MMQQPKKKENGRMKKLLDSQDVWLREPMFGMNVKILGLRGIYVTHELGKREYPLATEIRYFLDFMSNGRTHIEIMRFNGYEDMEMVLEDVGDLRRLGVRRRITREVYKRAGLFAKFMKKDLETLLVIISRVLSDREQILLESIKDTKLIEEAKSVFSENTQSLVGCIRGMKKTGERPSHERFALQDLTGLMTLTIDQVRHRFSPVEGKPYIEIVELASGNQPRIYKFLEEVYERNSIE